MQRTDSPSTITVANATVEVQDKLRVLGVTLDGVLSLDSHVSEIVKNCHFHLRALQHIRPSLTREVNTIACSVVAARIDYCNSILAGVSDKNLDKLHPIQNRTALIVCNVG